MNLSSDGYWPSGMTQADQARSLYEFGRMIYPIWRGIEERDIADDAKKSQEEIGAPGQYIFECITLHKQDHAIYRSGIKPNRVVSTPVKTAASQKYGSWQGRE